MRWARHVACKGEKGNAYNILVVKPEGKRNAENILVGKPDKKRPLGRPRRGWENNIRTDLREIWWEGVVWIHVTG